MLITLFGSYVTYTYLCRIIIKTKVMYHILFYKKNEGGCQKQDGFSTRAKALEWLKTFWDDVEWYSIEATV